MSGLPIAVLDTSVLVARWSRIALQKLAIQGRFDAVWSTAIVAETWRVVGIQRANEGDSLGTISRDAHEMWSKLDPVLRIVGASHRPPGTPPSPLRDRRDEHLWNAALNAGAQFVVSHNTRHFPPAVTVESLAGEGAVPVVRHIAHGVEFVTAIEFIEDVLGEDAVALYNQPLPPGIVRSRRSR